MPRTAPSSPLLVWLLLLVLGTACRSVAESEPRAADPAPPPEADYVLCFLLTGEAREGMAPERAQELQRGHMANIQRLARERTLLLAGPFAEPRLDPRWRGLFLFDVARLADARALVETDPAVEAGSLAARLHPFRSSPVLRSLPDLYEQHERERRAADPAAPAIEGRLYVLALASDGALAERALAPLIESGRVLLHGRFTDPDDELFGTAVFGLDEVDVDAARARLEAASARAQVELEWQVLPWFASSVLVQLPALASAAPEPSERERRFQVGGSIQAGIEHRR